MPGHPIMTDGPYTRSILRTLNVAFDGNLGGKAIVDLGCLEGGFTVEFARAGFDAHGIDARKLNIEKCEYVAERLHLPNLHFVQDDVRNVEKHGPFDAVFCAGLLYHLDEPAAFLRTLARVTRRVLILQTHYSTVDLPGGDNLVAGNYGLSPMTVHEGNEGRWYPEFEDGEHVDEVEKLVAASWGNHRSFWMERWHLIQCLRDAGFAPVYEQFDWLSDVVNDPYIREHDRSFFVAYRGIEPGELAS